ncbi:MAG: THUMP domain-containing protein [Candidatus Nitricoxidivorans perseverans]|uniref:THUMP domain-containing protein n=1 Tax=Candidatus Nitricoxidivorans perseverans TaxID=2975601 RepID=A0AA49IXH8_9PROT|nr:MAG: THUMP domain-containing protein [Candidatus Nitricoxidivorans perseverans]
MTERFFSPCPRGLEPLLAEDLAAAGAADIRIVPGGAAFSGSRETCYRVNLESRIATRVLRRLAAADYGSEDDLYKLALDIDWSRYFPVERTIRIYVTATRSPLKSLEFVTLRVKDAVCDRFRADTGRRPNVDTKNPDVRIHLFVTDKTATLYLDTSGEPLYIRGHKVARVGAPLKENLAAGILRLAGWKPGIPLLDPMCGSGTFLLEAAQMSLSDAPGLSRDAGGFGFERLAGFDAALWQRLRREAAERRVDARTLPIWGSDMDSDAVARTCQNLAHAGVDDLIRIDRADLLTRTAPAPEGILVANPPYGERLSEADELAAFYPCLGDALKKHFAGWDCWFLSADQRLPKLVGLKVNRKIPLFNGPLECRLYGFRMVAGNNR